MDNIDKQNKWSQMVREKERRKLKEKQKSKQGLRFGLGMFGLVGWSIVVPTVLGALLGIWLDKQFPGNRSWTLSLLLIGLVLGCFSAWHWVSRENKEIHKDEEKKDE